MNIGGRTGAEKVRAPLLATSDFQRASCLFKERRGDGAPDARRFGNENKAAGSPGLFVCFFLFISFWGRGRGGLPLGNILIPIPTVFSRKLKMGEIKKNGSKDRNLEDRGTVWKIASYIAGRNVNFS